tara:strand:- start:191 stop:394 length:204 start_codon:yes stop_codon:yes gene_type:complete
MKDKQVTLFGASGLIGGVLIKQLLEDPSISKIKMFQEGLLNSFIKKLFFFRYLFQIKKNLKKVLLIV